MAASSSINIWATKSLANQRVAFRKKILFFILLFLLLIYVFFTMKGLYGDFLTAFGHSSWAYKIAFARSYPFLTRNFFNNPATPDLVYNAWYANKKNVGPTGPIYSCCILDYDTTTAPGGPAGSASIGTIFGFLEQNPNAGYNELLCSVLSPSTSSQSAPGCNSSNGGPPQLFQCAGGTKCNQFEFASSFSLLNVIYQYVLPVVGLGVMILPMLLGGG